MQTKGLETKHHNTHSKRTNQACTSNESALVYKVETSVGYLTLHPRLIQRNLHRSEVVYFDVQHGGVELLWVSMWFLYISCPELLEVPPDQSPLRHLDSHAFGLCIPSATRISQGPQCSATWLGWGRWVRLQQSGRVVGLDKAKEFGIVSEI